MIKIEGGSGGRQVEIKKREREVKNTLFLHNGHAIFCSLISDGEIPS